MTYDGYFRRGDVIRFRHGSNVYTGTVVRIFDVIDGLEVQAEAVGGMRVSMKHVEQLVTPNLTEKECAALRELLAETGEVPVASLNALRRVRGDAPISGTTLHSLAERRLVVGAHPTLAAISGPLVWRLTAEGRRVANEL